MSYPENYRYTKEHEWAELTSDTQIKIGITDHAQSSLGDIVYLDLPQVGKELKANETFGVVESIKAVSDLYSPINGTVADFNAELLTAPEKINGTPHDQWMLVIEASDAKTQFEGLMDAKAYQDYVSTL